MAEILIIEDNDTMREGMVEILSRTGHDVQSARNGTIGLDLYKKINPDLVMTDLKMEGIDGFVVLKTILELDSTAVVVVITAFGTIEIAVEAMKQGAFDFITKPFPPDLLRAKVAHALEFARMRSENKFLRQESGKSKTDFLLGESDALNKIKEAIALCAPTDSSVLILGESGTGKDLIAKSIHAQSTRRDRPFIKTDCSSLAEGILESELFGHEKGSFTGAISRKQGRFELADHGTIFLDEVGELSLHLQTKLLRVLQDRTFERVGGSRSISVDVRVLAATNRDLAKEVKEGRFREDLYYRLNVIPIRMPPLRERPADIPILAEHFLQKHNQRLGKNLHLGQAAMAELQAYPWPGNVRELENLLERLCVLTKTDEIRDLDIPEVFNKISRLEPGSEHSTLELNPALEHLEKSLILEAKRRAGGVKLKMAQLLGIKPSALYYKLEKYGLHEED